MADEASRSARSAQAARRAESARRGELAAFLRARRARLRPADVGLPADRDPGLRRTPGLRREEVAQLSGVGVTWYTWLEQGRNISASEQVVDALARALRLDPDQRRHIRGLAGLRAEAGDTHSGDALPRLQRLVNAAAPSLASVYDLHFDYVVWNTPYQRLRHDPAMLPAGWRNLVWMMFRDGQNRARMVRWEAAARAVLSQFRAAAGQRPGDRRFTELVAELTEASPEFREWWAEYPIRDFRPATIEIDHPETGRLSLEIFQLRPVEHPDMLMVLQVPASTGDLRRVTSLLSSPGRGGQRDTSGAARSRAETIASRRER
jgi:transcriptional regulator with XRE-family HTH domain